MTRKVIAAAICLIAVVAAVIIYCLSSALQMAGAEGEQKTVYAYVTAIQGNEITYFEVDESVSIADSQKKEESGTVGDIQEGTQEEEQQNNESDNIADGKQQDRQLQEHGKSSMNGEGPTMDGEPSVNGEKPSGKMTTTAEGDLVTTLIPVGVTVYTNTDTKTTFLRLAQGDLLKLILETDADGKEIIVEIHMVQ